MDRSHDETTLGTTDTALELSGLSRRFGARAALSNVTYRVRRGTVFGLLGPNGAGKTTTVRLILGILRPSEGTVRTLGLDPIEEGQAVRSRCGVVLDQVGLYDRLTARANLEFACRVASTPAHERDGRIERALRRVDLFDRRNERVSGFSKGMRQKLAVARALLTDPDLLILDEPTSGLDPENIVMLRELLLALAEEGGRTVFLCTHLLAEAQKICSEVAILDAGHLLASGPVAELAGGGAPSFRMTLTRMSPKAAEELPPGAILAPIDGCDWRLTVRRVDDVEAVVASLVRIGVGVRGLTPERASLEETYLNVVGGRRHA